MKTREGASIRFFRTGCLLLLLSIVLGTCASATTLLVAIPTGSEAAWNAVREKYTQAHPEVDVQFASGSVSERILTDWAAGGGFLDLAMLRRERASDLTDYLLDLSGWAGKLESAGSIPVFHNGKIVGAEWPQKSDWLVCTCAGSRNKELALGLLFTATGLGEPLTLEVTNVHGKDKDGNASIKARLVPSSQVTSAALLCAGTTIAEKANFEAGHFALAFSQNDLSRTATNNLSLKITLTDGRTVTRDFTADPRSKEAEKKTLVFFYFLGEGLGLVPFECTFAAHYSAFNWSVPATGYIAVASSVDLLVNASYVIQRGYTPRDVDYGMSIEWFPKGPELALGSCRTSHWISQNSTLRCGYPTNNWWFIPGLGSYVTAEVTPNVDTTSGNVPGSTRAITLYLTSDATQAPSSMPATGSDQIADEYNVRWETWWVDRQWPASNRYEWKYTVTNAADKDITLFKFTLPHTFSIESTILTESSDAICDAATSLHQTGGNMTIPAGWGWQMDKEENSIVFYTRGDCYAPIQEDQSKVFKFLVDDDFNKRCGAVATVGRWGYDANSNTEKHILDVCVILAGPSK